MDTDVALEQGSFIFNIELNKSKLVFGEFSKVIIGKLEVKFYESYYFNI